MTDCREPAQMVAGGVLFNLHLIPILSCYQTIDQTGRDFTEHMFTVTLQCCGIYCRNWEKPDVSGASIQVLS